MSKKDKSGATEIVSYESGLDAEKHNALANTFNPFMENVSGLIETAKQITVETCEDGDAMKIARKTRLSLRKIRCDVESTRKALKEASLREGKAIDGMANIIKFIIVPVEEDLQAKEDFVKLAEERRIAELSESRSEELLQYDVDSQHFDLAAMTEEAFGQLLSSSKVGYEAKIQAEKAEAARIEAERIKEEKAEAEERRAEAAERKRLQEENAKLEKAARAEAKKRETLEAARRKAEKESARLRKEAEDKERAAEAESARIDAEKREAEIDAARVEKEAEQARLSAPDKDKIDVLVADICALSVPSVSSNIALDAIADARGLLNGVVKRLRTAQKELSKKKGGKQ